MDTLHSALFYAFAAVALAGGLLTALGRSRSTGTLGLLLVAIGAGLLLADLSGGFAGLVVFLLLAGAAALVATIPAPAAEAAASRADNLGALVAALLFAAFAYASYRGTYHSTGYPGGTFNAAALGRLLIGRDALALIAVAGAALIGIGQLPRLRKSRR